MYGLGAAMGFTPGDVDGMSLWQFRAAAEGFAELNGADPGMTDEEFDAAAAALDAAPERTR